MNGARLRWGFVGLPPRWRSSLLGAPIFYRLWANVPATTKRDAAGRWFVHQGAAPEPVKNRRSQYRLPRGLSVNNLPKPTSHALNRVPFMPRHLLTDRVAGTSPEIGCRRQSARGLEEVVKQVKMA